MHRNSIEIIREKGIDAIIEYESELSLDGSEEMFDRMIRIMIEKIKNEKTLLSEKKYIIVLLDNIINNGRELKEQNAILRISSDLEEEGIKIMKKEGISKEKRKEWKELTSIALISESTIIKKKKKDMEGRKVF